MKKHLRFSMIVFYALSAVAVAIAVISLVNSFSWIDKTFPGFLIYKFPYGGSFSCRDWPSVKTGPKLMDKVVSADQRPVREGPDVLALAGEKNPGTRISYVLERSGRTRTVAIPTITFSLTHWFLTFFVTFATGLILFLLGFIVFLLKPRTITTWVFFLFCFFSSLYMVTGFDVQSTYWFCHLHYFIMPFMPATLVHLGLVFPQRTGFLARHPVSNYLIYVPAVCLGLAYQAYLFTFLRDPGSPAGSWIPDISSITAVSRIFTFSAVPAFLVLTRLSLFPNSSILIRQRRDKMFWMVLVSILPIGLIMLVVFFLKVNFPWNFLPFFVLLFSTAIGYSIMKHNIFEVDAAIRRSVGYIILTAGVSIVYTLFLYVINIASGRFEMAESPVFPLVFILAIVFFLNPIRNRAQKVVDRIFFRLDYKPEVVLQKVSEKMRSLLKIDEVAKCIMDTVSYDMFIESGSILLLNPERKSYECLPDGPASHGGEVPEDHPLIQKLNERKKEVTRYDLQEDESFKGIKEACQRAFNQLRAAIVIPLIYGSRVTGLISLGDKKSGTSYHSADISLLKTMANQGAAAIETARLHESILEEQTLSIELKRHLSPQVVDQLIRNKLQIKRGGEKKVVTVLFSDIRSFTQISETLVPEKLVQLLNEYFTEMAKIIFQNQGSLDKYIGDAIVAVFGSSLISSYNPARSAVQAAIQMMKSLEIKNHSWSAEYGFPIHIGIGINTGEVFWGSIGSPERMEFTVIGDPVNVASRFSGAASPGQILVTRDTLDRMGYDMNHRSLGFVDVKGKQKKQEAFVITYS